MKVLRTASLGSNFTGSYQKKECNAHEKVKIFEIIESRKFRENVDDPFGLKRLFSCINIPDKFLA